jgi:hypothetical protein
MGGADAFLAAIVHNIISNVGGQFYPGRVLAFDI